MRCWELTVEFLENFLGCFDSVVLGFLEDGDAAEVGVGEEDAVIQTFQAVPLFREYGTEGRANHGVAHAHDVDVGDALTDVRVDALEIVKDGFLPVGPVFFEKKLAVLGGGTFGEGPVKGQTVRSRWVRTLWCMAST